jgi:hypothetical protein
VEHDPYKQSDDGQLGAIEQSSEQEIERPREPGEVVPGAPVVRSNTPRPLSFNMLLAAGGHAPEEEPEAPAIRSPFPSKAPSAPPLPEELEDTEKEPTAGDVEVATLTENASEPQEFVWLFEYGLEMDSTTLNSTDRLNGAAFLYGPAVLKGYTLMLAQSAQNEIPSNSPQLLVTIVPHSDPDAEVWGVLYRIPRHVTLHNSNQPSLLDTVHSSGTARSLFHPAAIVVREIYREREIACGTYMLTDSARQQLRLLTLEQAGYNTPLVQRLTSLARKHKLPAQYLNRPAKTRAMPASNPSERTARYTATPLPREQNTEPIPALKETGAITTAQKRSAPTSSRLLTALAVYLILVLLFVLLFAVLQGLGFGSRVLTPGVEILGVPWLVLFYGLLGSCMSSLVALARSRQVRVPLFALVLWFARPYLGIILAALAYLLFMSGLFVFAEVAVRHSTLLPLLGGLAGLSESWLFLRRAQ